MLIFFLFFIPISLFGVVTCDFQGRLGNQLFQIAATMNLAEELKTEPIFFLKLKNPDLQNDLMRNYQWVYPKIPLRNLRYPASFEYKELDYHYSEIPLIDDMRIVGFFQSEEYFKKHKEKIIPYFLPTKRRVDALYAKHPWLKKENTVSVHLRCYFKEGEEVINYWAVLSKDYFLKAMALFPKESHFVFFSDDIEYCKKLFKDEVENAHFIKGQTWVDDFYMMGLCRDNIISNSSFSWWAAYLNQNSEKKVVAPSLWGLNDFERANVIIPKDWIKIDFDYKNPLREDSISEK